MMLNVRVLQKMRDEGNKIVMLTCYDAAFARLLEEAGVEILLVGDSLGMVLQGHRSTLPVSLDEMVYHTRCVAKGVQDAMVLADLPFGAYQQSREQAFESSVRLMQAGAQMVKLEGGEEMVDTVAYLTNRGVPVCAHIGLQPQSVNISGGYVVQGRNEAAAQKLVTAAKMLEQAGASMVLIECVPAAVAAQITDAVSCPTIGIGAGAGCSGQVLVLHDMLGIFPQMKSRFVKNYLSEAKDIQEAVSNYVKEVKAGVFPTKEHSF